MEVVCRDDIDLAGGSRFSYKEMTNGEIRNRIVFASGNRASETRAENWSLNAEEFPWQDAHFHHGMTEYYLITSGWAVFLFEEKGKIYDVRPKAGHLISFPPLFAHTVLMGPASEMLTLLVGEKVGNPERNGEDWWPVPNKHLWELEKIKIEETLRL